MISYDIACPIDLWLKFQQIIHFKLLVVADMDKMSSVIADVEEPTMAK